jgi:fructokinase
VRLGVEPGIGRWQAVVDEMAALAHLLKISAEDLAMLHPGIEPAEIARRWLEQGVRLVVVTHGSAGSEAWTRQVHAKVEPVRVQVVDTVGAGDTFQAALLAWLDEYGVLSPEGVDALGEAGVQAALGFAGRAAAITCSRRGADLPRRAELD